MQFVNSYTEDQITIELFFQTWTLEFKKQTVGPRSGAHIVKFITLDLEG